MNKQSLYRPCVGIMLLNHVSKVFVARRIDRTSEAWQMPQGGIDDGEEPVTALFREMREEIGTDKAKIEGEMEEWLYYDLPPEIRPQLWGGRYHGQRQKWYALRFTGKTSDINLETEHPEFLEWRWEEPASVTGLAVPFKRETYRRVFEAFSHLISS